jgi:hypothetical protein
MHVGQQHDPYRARTRGCNDQHDNSRADLRARQARRTRRPRHEPRTHRTRIKTSHRSRNRGAAQQSGRGGRRANIDGTGLTVSVVNRA